MYESIQVTRVTDVRDARDRLLEETHVATKSIESALRTFRGALDACQDETRRRRRLLSECMSQHDADCSALRRRYETALAVERTVAQAVEDVRAQLAHHKHRLTETSRGAAAWLWNVVEHLGGVAPGTTTSATAVSASTGGGTSPSTRSDSAPTDPSTGSTVRALGSVAVGAFMLGHDFGTDVRRVTLAAVEVPPDLFTTEPSDGYTADDLMWAATTFRDAVVPHLARGGTREDLREMDHASGNFVGLRRLEGAWEVYLGTSMVDVDVDSSGQIVSFNNGRHRTLAAQMAGLSWIPMRVRQVAE